MKERHWKNYKGMLNSECMNLMKAVKESQTRFKKSCKLRKETKTNEVYLELYSYELIPPCLYWTIIVHKSEKNFPCDALFLQ